MLPHPHLLPLLLLRLLLTLLPLHPHKKLPRLRLLLLLPLRHLPVEGMPVGEQHPKVLMPRHGTT